MFVFEWSMSFSLDSLSSELSCLFLKASNIFILFNIDSTLDIFDYLVAFSIGYFDFKLHMFGFNI